MRWTIEDHTTKTGGYLVLACQGMSVCIDAFPFKRGADEQAVRRKAQTIIDLLNGAEEWRRISKEVGTPANQFLNTDEGSILARAVDAL